MTFRDLTPLFHHSADHVVVAAWTDPKVDVHGFPVEGEYVEHFWVSTLGPTATLLLRRLAAIVTTHPSGATVDLPELAGGLGLVWVPGRPCPMRRAVERLVMFGAAAVRTERLVVRRSLPPLTARQIERLPAGLRAVHSQWIVGARTDARPWGAPTA